MAFEKESGSKSIWQSLRTDDERNAFAKGFNPVFKQTNDYQRANAAGAETLAAFRAAQPAEIKTPEQPEKQIMQPAYKTWKLPFTGQEVQSFFASKTPSSMTAEDIQAQSWKPSELTGMQYFRSLDDSKKDQYSNLYQDAVANGANHQDAMKAAQDALEGNSKQAYDLANRKALLENDTFRQDVNEVMGIDAFNTRPTEEQDKIINAWNADNQHGVDAIWSALNGIDEEKKAAETKAPFTFAQAQNEVEPYSLEPGERITPYDLTIQKYNERRQALEDERSNLQKEIRVLGLDINEAEDDNEREELRNQVAANNQRLEQIDQELRTLEENWNTERNEHKIDREENDARLAELHEQLDPRLDRIAETLGSLKAQYTEAWENGDQAAMSQLARQMAALESQEAQLQAQLNELDITRQKWNAGLNAVANTIGNTASAIAEGAKSKVLNWADYFRALYSNYDFHNDREVQLEFKQAQKEWDALGLSDEEKAKREEEFWADIDRQAESINQKLNALASTIEESLKNQTLTTDEYIKKAQDAVLQFMASDWQEGAFERYNDVEKITDFLNLIETKVFKGTGYQFGHQIDSLLLSFLSGGKEYAEVAKGLKGIPARLKNLLSDPIFYESFVNEYVGDRADAFRSNRELTNLDKWLMVGGAAIKGAIEVGFGKEDAGGVEAYWAGRVENTFKSALEESGEEFKQDFVDWAEENLGHVLQGRYDQLLPVYSPDVKDNALFNLEKDTELLVGTFIQTLGMDVMRMPLNAIVKSMAGEPLTDVEKAEVEQAGRQIAAAVEAQQLSEEFEAAENHEETQPVQEEPVETLPDIPAENTQQPTEPAPGRQTAIDERNKQAEEAQQAQAEEKTEQPAAEQTEGGDFYQNLSDEQIEFLKNELTNTLDLNPSWSNKYKVTERNLKRVQEEQARRAVEAQRPAVKAPAGLDETQAQAFKEKFGNSEAVDDKGNPIEFYHGTNAEFDKFDKDKAGTRSAGDKGFYGKGIYFARFKETAKGYGKNIKKAWLRMENPFNMDQEFWSINGESAPSEYDSSAFALNVADKFPELANAEMAKAITKEGKEIKLTIKEYADLFRQALSENEGDIRKAARAVHDQFDKLNVYISENVIQNMENLSEVLQQKGYDSIIKEKGFKEYVVFDPDQIIQESDLKQEQATEAQEESTEQQQGKAQPVNNKEKATVGREAEVKQEAEEQAAKYQTKAEEELGVTLQEVQNALFLKYGGVFTENYELDPRIKDKSTEELKELEHRILEQRRALGVPDKKPGEVPEGTPPATVTVTPTEEARRRAEAARQNNEGTNNPNNIPEEEQQPERKYPQPNGRNIENNEGTNNPNDIKNEEKQQEKKYAKPKDRDIENNEGTNNPNNIPTEEQQPERKYPQPNERDIENNEGTNNPNDIPAEEKKSERKYPAPKGRDIENNEGTNNPNDIPAEEKKERSYPAPNERNIENNEGTNNPNNIPAEEQKPERKYPQHNERNIENNEGTINPQNIPSQEANPDRKYPAPNERDIENNEGTNNPNNIPDQQAAQSEKKYKKPNDRDIENNEGTNNPQNIPDQTQNKPVQPEDVNGPENQEDETENEPTDEGEQPHAVDTTDEPEGPEEPASETDETAENNTQADIDRETEAAAKEHGFKWGETNGDGSQDAGVHLVGIGSRLTQDQIADLKVADALLKELGWSAEIRGDLPEYANGLFRGERTIYLGAGVGNPLPVIQGHELYHGIQRWAPNSAKEIDKIFENAAERSGFDVEQRIEQLLDVFNRTGSYSKLNEQQKRAQAKKEIMANYAAVALSDINFAKQVCMQDRSLMQRIIDWAKQMQTRIQEMLKRFSATSPEAKLLMENERDMRKIQEIAAQALRELKELDPIKKAATSEHGNGEWTKRYERQVNDATSKQEITDASRELAKALLMQTRNKVTDNNIAKLMWAADDVRAGMLPYQALKEHDLNTDGINEELRRGLRMLGGYLQNIQERADGTEYNALMLNQRQEQKEEFSVDETRKNSYNTEDKGRNEVQENDRRRTERIRERAKRNRVSGRGALRGPAALRLNRGDYSGVIAKGGKGYELFREALEETEIKSRKGDPIIWYHGSEYLFDKFEENIHKNTDGAVGHYFTSSPKTAYGYAGDRTDKKNIYPVGIYSKHNIEFNANEFTQNYKIQNKALEIIKKANKYAVRGVDEKFLKALDQTLRRGIKDNGISKEVAGKIIDAFINHGVIQSVTLKNCLWDVPGQTEANNQIIVFDDEAIVPATAEIWEKMADEDGRLDSRVQNDFEEFSIKEPVEQTRDLVAVHNLSGDAVRAALDMGGLPSPSVAVVKADQGHSNYGDVSFVFDKSSIDPKNKKNKIYGTDAWTPTRHDASVATKVNQDALIKESKKAAEVLKDTYQHLQNEADRYLRQIAYDDSTSKSIDDLALEARHNVGMLAYYLKSKNKDIDIKQREIIDDLGYRPAIRKDYDAFLNKLEANGMINDLLADATKLSNADLVEKYGPIWAETSDGASRIWNAYKEKGGRLPSLSLHNRIFETAAYLNDNRGSSIGTKREPDWYATRDAMQEEISKADFDEWFKGVIEPALGRKGIRNQLDQFTPSGNRRNFDQLHWDYTLENIVKAMNMANPKGGFSGGYTALMARSAKEYKNISEVRKDKGRLQTLEKDEYRKLIENLEHELNEFINKVSDRVRIYNGNVREAIADAGAAYAKYGSGSAIKRAFADSNIKLNDDEVAKAEEIIKKAQEVPTGYFEAKPQRAVNFDEVKLAVLPESTDPELIKRLREAGVGEIQTYPDGDEEARKNIINNADALQFSIDEGSVQAGQEEYNRQTEFTGGQTEILQRLTGDLWRAISERKAQQKAENYGMWKQHVAEMARELKAATNSSVFTDKELEDRLTKILEEHEAKKAGTREEAQHAINDTLNELQGLIQEALSDQLMDEHAREVFDVIKKGIYVNPDQVKELGGPSELRDYRNSMKGVCRVYTSEKAANAAGALHLDGHGWDELQSIDPDLFNPDMHWLERAQALRDFVDLYSDSYMRVDPVTRDFIQTQALETLAEYYSGSNENDATKRTREALKKANAKVDSLTREQQAALAKQSELNEQIKNLKTQAREADSQAWRERSAVQAERDKLQQDLKAAREEALDLGRQLSEAGKEAEKLNNELSARDNREAYLQNTISLLKKQNAANQKAAVRDALNRNKESAKQRAADRQNRQNIKKLEMKMRRMLENPSNSAYVPLDKVRVLLNMVEAIQKADTRKAAQATDKWLRTVRELREDTNSLLKDAYDEGFIAQMQEVGDILKDKTINQLDSEELQYVSNVMTQALHQIEQATKMIGWERNTDALVEAHSFVDTVNKHKPQPTGGIGKVVNNLATEHLTPQRELDKLAGHRTDNAIYRQKESLSEGQRVTNKTKMDQTKNFEQLITGKNAKNFEKWAGKKADVIDTGINGSRHGTFKMTHDFLTTLYMHSTNQQNMDGMKNGLTVPDYQLWKQGKKQEAWDRAERMYVTDADMKRLMSMVSEYDKQWAAAWKANQEYITPILNDVSMQLNGWHRFAVENYFPIRRDKNYLATDFDSIMLDDRISNMGFTKMRKNAKNPMMLESMLDVVNRSINGTSLYAGMLIPVTNFNKVFNMSMPDFEDSPKAALRRVFGNKEMEYIERMMKDLQQAGIRADSSIFDKVRAKAAPAALGANLGVVIKQAASYPTAAAVLGFKPLLKQLTSPRKFSEETVNKYTSAYWERSDANIAAMNANVQSGGIERTSNLLNKPIGAMDRATVRMIWGACEYAIEDEQPNLKRGSDEYYQAVARKYEECLEMTQPEYGTMQRPHIMRSNNTLQKAMTMYKTQSFQNLNIVYDAVADYRTQAQMYKEDPSAENKAELDRSKTKLARAVSSQIVSATVLALMTAVGKALLHKPEPYQDDKGELTPESVSYQLSKDAISSMAGMITGGSELFDLITGIAEGKQPYDIDASAISMINDLYQSIYKLGVAATTISDSSLTPEQKLEKGAKAVDNFMKSAGSMMGLPYNNLRNIGTSAYKYVDDIINGRGLEGLTTGDVTLNTAARYMGEALQKGDADTYTRLYNRLLQQGKTQKQINTALRTWMKTGDARIQQAANAIDSGDLDTYNRLINEMSADGLGMANVVTAIEAVRKAGNATEEAAAPEYSPMTYEQIMNAMEQDSDSVYTNAQLNQLLENGNIQAAKKVQSALFKKKNGVTSVKSALTSYWKPKYREAYQSRNRTELNRITKLMKAMGYSDSSLKKWKEVDTDTSSTSNKKSSSWGSSTFGKSFGSSSKKSSKKSSGFGGSSFGGGWGS